MVMISTPGFMYSVGLLNFVISLPTRLRARFPSCVISHHWKMFSEHLHDIVVSLKCSTNLFLKK